jgi:lysophospholipid acyltransferase (LPLAT)-like uncharacterized protein
LGLDAGKFLRQGGNITVCFDLPKGPSTLEV